MQKFRKSPILLYLNIILCVFFLSGSIFFFSNLGKTTITLGIDLFLIFGIVLIIFASPFILNLIRYLLLPKIVLTINKDQIVIHKRKKDYIINAGRLLAVSKINSVGGFIGLDIGTLKLLFRDLEVPSYIRYIEGLDKAYQTLRILNIQYYEHYSRVH